MLRLDSEEPRFVDNPRGVRVTAAGYVGNRLTALGRAQPWLNCERHFDVHTLNNRRRLAAAALALAATSTLAACGGADSEAKEAASAAEAGPSYEPGATLTEAEAKELMNAAAESISTVHVAMDIVAVEEGEKVTGSGEGDFQLEPLAFQVKGEATDAEGPTALEFITVDDETYANMDGDWVKGGFVALMAAVMPPPSIFVESVTSAITEDSTTYVGQETVDGVDTAHYTFDAGETDFGAEGSSVDVNIDAEDRVVRMRMDGGDAGEITFDFSAHGEPVTIEKPAGEVVDMSDMDMG